MKVRLVARGSRRLDAHLTERLDGIPRRRIAAAIREGAIRVNGRRAKPGDPVREGDRVSGEVDAGEVRIEPAKIKLEIVFEDRQLVAVNKPAGLLVQATRHEARRTLASALLARYGELPSAGGRDRAGIVHRLDRGVSGVVVCARTQTALGKLMRQFRERSVEKTYWALVEGRVRRERFEIDAPLSLARRTYRAKVSRRGKPALTRVKVRRRLKGRTVLEVVPVTGRPHQIRVHLASIGHPIVGDPTYGTAGRIGLHAERLKLRHPGTGRSLALRAPLPEELKQLSASP